MTAAARPSRLPQAGLRTPPWLWVWLVYLLSKLPAMISDSSSGFTAGGGTSAPALPGGAGFAAVARLSLIFLVLVFAMLVAGMTVVAFPQLRGRWVERRFRLASDGRPVIAEMQRFVDCYDPSVRLRVSMRSDQMARIYPVGWRSARIAVFRPLAALWRLDREAAQAVLLHEVAHRRQGDQLVTGLGSPFVWLIRIGVPTYLLFVLIPSAIFLAAEAGPQSTYAGSVVSGMMASFIAGFAATLAGAIPLLVFLPVTALWLAELDADQQTVRTIGPGAFRRALQAAAVPRANPAARAMALLSHPPRRLRLSCAAARPAGPAALMAAWPASVAAFVLVLPFAIDGPLYYSSHIPLSTTIVESSAHDMLAYDMPLVIMTAVVLLVWPALAGPWERLWSQGPRTVGRRPWWPSLAAASLPAGMLILFLAPLQPGSQELAQAATPQAPSGGCSPAARWVFDGGLGKYDVGTAYYQLVEAQGSKSAMAAAAQRLDATIRAALANPPPGAARSVYITSMTEYRAAVQDLIAGNIIAADNEDTDATSSYLKAVNLVSAAADPIQDSAGCNQVYSP